MPWSSQLPGSRQTACLLLLAGRLVAQSPGPSAGAAAEADAPAATPAPAAAAAASPEAEAAGQTVEVAASDLSSLNRLLPIGKTARKVTVPTVDEEGRLTSVVTMGSITRVDEENFDLEKVVLTSFDPPDQAGPGAPPDQTVITLIRARYHAPTQVLVSDRVFTLRKPTLYMTGDSLQYDSATGRARIKGKSMALITDAPRLDTAPEEDGGGEEEDEEEIEAAEEDTTTESPPESKPGSPPAQPTPKRP